MTTLLTWLADRPAGPARSAQSRRVGPWVMHQRWHNLLFAHWRMPADVVRRQLPKGVELDTFEGDAWVSVIPFYMTGVRFRWSPPIPTAHAFAELNVRTYVTYRGHAGIWFFSLDAESTIAVVGARLGAALPYFRANMRVRCGARNIDYRSDRTFVSGAAAGFDATYSPRGPAYTTIPGSLDFFLTERYCLFSSGADRLWRIDVEHPTWQLHAADVVLRNNTMIEAAGLDSPDADPVLHFATSQDVHFWPPVRVA